MSDSRSSVGDDSRQRWVSIRSASPVGLTRLSRLCSIALGVSLVAATAMSQSGEWWVTDRPGATLFGQVILPIDDADGDGRDDLIVSVPLGYTERGRTGSVLVVSSETGKLLNRLDGEPHKERFGWSAAVVSRDASGRAEVIAIGGRECKLLSSRPYRLEERLYTNLYSYPG